MSYKYGDKVIFKNANTRSFCAKDGATATVRYMSGCYIYVVWDRTNPLYNNQADGEYHIQHFSLILPEVEERIAALEAEVASLKANLSKQCCPEYKGDRPVTLTLDMNEMAMILTSIGFGTADKLSKEKLSNKQVMPHLKSLKQDFEHDIHKLYHKLNTAFIEVMQ